MSPIWGSASSDALVGDCGKLAVPERGFQMTILSDQLELAPDDLDSYWMPFTANRQFKAAPRMFGKAEGMHYTTVDGRKVIDGSAGLWCVNAGHGRRQIAAAVEKQLTNLDFAPSFNMGHPLAFDFAERLAEIAPKGIDRIFFTNSGSESVDTA